MNETEILLPQVNGVYYPEEHIQYFYVLKHGDVTTHITIYSHNMLRIERFIGEKDHRELPTVLPSALASPGLVEVHDEPAQPPREETIFQKDFVIHVSEDGCIQCYKRKVFSEQEPFFREVSGRHLLHTEGRLIHSFQLDDCLYYGFGEKTGPLEKTGMRMRFSGKDACGYDPEHTDPLYKHVPFFLKMRKDGGQVCGVYYNTAADCELDIGREVNGYYPPMGQFLTAEKNIDLFLFYGYNMAQILEAFTKLTGRPAMPPKYALGYLGSSMYYPELGENCDKAILGFVEKAKKLGIPCSNFQLSSGYTTDDKGRRNVFTWNSKKFPDPKGFVEKMEALGVTITPNVKPAMLTTHPLYASFAREGAFIRNRDGSPYVTRFWGGQGSFVDFTNPNACGMWKNMLRESLLQYGIRSVWNDNNEFDLVDGYCYDEGRFTPATRLRGVLPMLMCKTAWEAIAEYYPGKRPYLVSRSGCAGINRYAQVWTGDNRTSWQSLKWNIAIMLGSGLSGMPITGSDVGGFAGPAPEKELFLRWIACGAVMPRFSIHSANDDNTVTEPWMYPSQMDAVRSLFGLRSRLMPLLYSLHFEAHQTGKPIWRPMVWQFPEDKRSQRENVDFMLGDGLLCACVVEQGAKTRTVWLPEGTVFYDFYTRQRHEGGQEITLEAPLDRLPLLQKGGSIVPTREEDGIHLWICPEKDCCFTYYDDDGEYMSVYSPESVVWELEVSQYSDWVRCRFTRGSNFRCVHIQCQEKAPSGVLAQDRPLERFLDEEAFRNAETGWYYDAERKLCSVHSPNLQDLIVFFKPADLIKIDGE